MKFLNVRQLALLFTLIIISCQEDQFIEKPDLVDEDMVAAKLLAEDYFSDIRGKGDKPDKDELTITSLQYRDGKIYYDTNNDDIDGYQLVTETTVTASVKTGDYVFWYRGKGLSALKEVDFDEAAEAYLDELPEEYKRDRMWVIKVPSDYDPSINILKYDIVYESKENRGIVVRLDPKITVGGQSDTEPDQGE